MIDASLWKERGHYMVVQDGKHPGVSKMSSTTTQNCCMRVSIWEELLHQKYRSHYISGKYSARKSLIKELNRRDIFY